MLKANPLSLFVVPGDSSRYLIPMERVDDDIQMVLIINHTQMKISNYYIIIYFYIFICSLLFPTIMAPVAPRPTLPLSFRAKCQCGKVVARINSVENAPPLRLVCYCKDCRGYYESLNHLAADAGAKTPPAKLDNWGGVDWTSIYPRDVTILQGQDLLATTKIRDNSPIRQVYSSCCQTPMFRCGGMSMLVNSNLLVPEDEQDIDDLPVTFRIIGRDSWKKGRDDTIKKPSMSFSVPFKWFWTMPGRIHKDYMEPKPFDLQDAKDCKVLPNFHEGSDSYQPAEKA